MVSPLAGKTFTLLAAAALITVTDIPVADGGSFTLSAALATVVIRFCMAVSAVANAWPPPARAAILSIDEKVWNAPPLPPAYPVASPSVYHAPALTQV
jgi:hypothetical protein